MIGLCHGCWSSGKHTSISKKDGNPKCEECFEKDLND